MECEAALNVIVSSFRHAGLIVNSGPTLVSSFSFTPRFKVAVEDRELFFDFFPGHGRWNISLATYIASKGAPLKEAVDAFITEVKDEEELPLAAFEFCNALPAGNNAWQRMGRAFAMIAADIPYFYFADIGGQELDSNRQIKAPRFPNPIVPFSYLAATSSSQAECSTIYLPSPSISEETFSEFENSFGNNEYKHAITKLFDFPAPPTQLKEAKLKSANFIYDLVKRRRSNTTYDYDTWVDLLDKATKGEPIADLIKNADLTWSKRISIPSTTTLKGFLSAVKSIGVDTVGSSDMPFCLLPGHKRTILAQQLMNIYRNSINQDLLDRLTSGEKDIVIAFVAGFKPRGDDSRPDRGLLPLARMFFSNDDVEYLSVIYGPGTPATWKRLFTDYKILANTNGLWEAVLGLSDMVLVDSPTFDLRATPIRSLLIKDRILNNEIQKLKPFSPIPRFGEHDVDSTLHILFARSEENGVYESLCNPPGGDWSGVSITDSDGNVTRWTSLPRVSGIEGKRPDHIIQFTKHKIILSIESKDTLANLESGIGPRLDQYTQSLLESGSAQARKLKDSLEWSQLIDPKGLRDVTKEYKYFSAAAFMCRNPEQLTAAVEKSNTDLIIGINFENELTTIYVKQGLGDMVNVFIEFLRSQQDKLSLIKTEVILVP